MVRIMPACCRLGVLLTLCALYSTEAALTTFNKRQVTHLQKKVSRVQAELDRLRIEAEAHRGEARDVRNLPNACIDSCLL